MTPHPDKALIIFARSPRAVQEKSKLLSHLTPEQAEGLFASIMLDAIDLYHSVPDVDNLLFYESPEDEAYFRARYPEASLHAQEGETHIERMINAFGDAFALGHRRVMFFPTDLPTLPRRSILSGYQILDAFEDAVVLGPTDQGGLYALGLRMLLPEMFQGINFGKPHLYDQVMKRICTMELTPYVLPSWYTIDSIASVRKLDADLANPEFNGHILSRTKAYMQELRERDILPQRGKK